MKLLYRFWFRLNVILGCPFLLILDYLIVKTENISWEKQHLKTKIEMEKVWNKY